MSGTIRQIVEGRYTRQTDFMKKIEAIIKPFKLEEVKTALAEIGIEGMTLTEIRELVGRQKSRADFYNNAEYIQNFRPMFKIETVVADTTVTDAIAAIVKAAKTDKSGDGRIFITSVEQAIRIRTGENLKLSP